jgi:peroxiredoxin
MSIRNYLILVLGLAAAVLAGCASAEQTGVAKSPTTINPALIGTRIPDMALFDSSGKKVELGNVLARKPTILVVYKGNWCLYCQQQLEAMQKIEPDLLALGYQILAVSPDPPAELQKSIQGKNLRYQLLSDEQLSLAKTLGLAYSVDDRTRMQMESFGVIPKNVSAQPDWMLPVPAVFIVSADNRIRWEYVNPDLRERVPTSVLMAAAQALAEKPRP